MSKGQIIGLNSTNFKNLPTNGFDFSTFEFPEEWNGYLLRNLYDFFGGKSIPRNKMGEEGTPCLHYGDIHTSPRTQFNLDELIKNMPKVKMFRHSEDDFLKDGDLVFADASEDYEGIAKAVLITNPSEREFIPGLHTIVARKKSDRIDKNFSQYMLSSWLIRKQFMFYAQGISVYGISKSSIEQTFVMLPPIEEQKKIATLLATWDDAINLSERLYENLSKYKKSVLSLVLSEKSSSILGISKTIKPLKFYLTEENEKTIINNQYDIITSTIDDLYLQSEYFNRQIASKNNIGYKILKRNRLVLSPQNAWMGNVNLNFKYGIGIVSPSYKVYNLQNCDLNFFAQFVKSDIFISILDKNSQTGASVVRKSLNVKSLLDTELQLPTLEEQKIYGDLFNNLEKQLGLLLKQIKYYTEQKQALMQKFLNGKIRVKTSRKGDDYESRI